MYIEPFWCGIIATILFELFLVILIAMISMPKAGGKGKDEKNNS